MAAEHNKVTDMSKYKKPKATRKKVKILGTKEFVDSETGEVHKMQVTDIEERDANFHKIWLGHLLETLDLIGNKKIKVAMFIMSDLNKENQFLGTHRYISEQTGVSLPTVTETMSVLQESNFLIKVRNGFYRVNPDVLFKGGKGDRMNVLLRYTNGE
ncbi:replication/maintenance protein RepL [Thalassobacillus sp. C254]|uniref:replication/maintenance protein RepL n=1 Tax=Thalassobacillus sp. C254 TaxID=1225341 RepID=UPI0006CF2380|nr:replication/maintenance protein RepL [Thalassobacillus sp. C254]